MDARHDDPRKGDAARRHARQDNAHACKTGKIKNRMNEEHDE